VEASGSFLVPHSSDAMTWRIGDHGFLMTLSAQVPGLIEEHLEAFLSDWLAQRGETVESIGGWATHPGGPKILTSVEQSLQLDPEALRLSRSVLSDHGNMSSATMLFILERFALNSIPKPWLMLGFGPGLEIEVALIR
jgi:predicted naringenin-chalcone synthase